MIMHDIESFIIEVLYISTHNENYKNHLLNIVTALNK